MSEFLNLVRSRNPGETEFHQAVQKVLDRVKPVLDRNPQYRQSAILERIIEPERVRLISCQLAGRPGTGPGQPRLPDRDEQRHRAL